MVKPDGVARGVIADIIGRWEKRGFTLVRCSRVVPAGLPAALVPASLDERRREARRRVREPRAASCPHLAYDRAPP